MSLKQLRAPLVPRLKELKPEIDAVLSQEQNLPRALDLLESQSEEDTGETHEEQPGWDREF